jgi:rod shape-determining protein MreC
MESVLGRYRNLIILVGVLFLQLLGLAVQVKRSADAENTRLIRIWAVSAITPLERCLVRVQNSGADLWHNYFYLRGVRAENRQLKEQIEQMRLEQVRLSEDAAQAHRLQTLLAFKEQFVLKTVAAQVIGASGSDSSRILYIDKGENEGLARDMAVVTADGIVGKVLQVFPSVSQVLLINDQSSGVGALLEKSRLQGVLKGTANGEIMLERLTSDEQIQTGEKVLTSGGDQIFPKGLPVGTVANVGAGRDLFLNIKVRPAANLSKLEEVLVVTEKQERQVKAPDTARMRAADILAQRLPSVPEKPATPEANVTAGSPAGAKPGTAAAKPQSKPAAVPSQQTGVVTKAQESAASKPHGTPTGTTPHPSSAKDTDQVGSTVTHREPASIEPVTNGDSKPAALPDSAPAGASGPSQPATGTKSPGAPVQAEPQASPPGSANPPAHPNQQPPESQDGPH